MNPSSKHLEGRILALENDLAKVLKTLKARGITLLVDTMSCDTKGEDEPDQEICGSGDGESGKLSLSERGSLPLERDSHVQEGLDSERIRALREEARRIARHTDATLEGSSPPKADR